MSFLTPLFLIAAAAGAIPLVLHMINRQKAKEVPFSTLRFLQISVQKTRRRQRLHDLLLMILRAAVLVLIAVGLAAPTLRSLPSLLGSGSNSAVAIILDNSASMGTIDEGQPRFETAKQAAAQILDQLEDGDQAALFLTGGPSFPEQGRLDRTHERVRQMLTAAAVSHERADMSVKLQAARKLLAEAEAGNQQIFVITDMQRLSWENLDTNSTSSTRRHGTRRHGDTEKSVKVGPQAADIPIIIVDCNRAPQPNVAVGGVRLDAPVPVAGLPITATVELFNSSPVPQKRHLELFTDGAKRSTSPAIDIPAAGTARHVFQFTFNRGGLHRGEVRLSGTDGCRLDDRRYFAIDIGRGIPVAVVKHRRHEIPYLDDTFYLEQALSAGPSASGGQGAVWVTTLTASDLPGEPLSQYKIVFCVNLPAPSAEAAGRLAQYVENGGNLFWIAGDEFDPQAYNRINDECGGRLLPARLAEVRMAADVVGEDGTARDSWHIAQLDSEYRAFEGLLEPASLYTSVLVYQHVAMEVAMEKVGNGLGPLSDARILARLDDGRPLLAERAVGHGNVLLLGTSLHTDWTNLPLRPIFLPLLVQTTFELAGVRQGRRRTLAGAHLQLQFAQRTQPIGIEVVRPTGETIRLKTSRSQTGQTQTGQTQTGQSQTGQTFRYADTHSPGIYLVRPLESVLPNGTVAFSVNVDPDEARADAIEREDLKTRLGASTVIFAENPHDLSATFDWLRQGRGLWEIFLWVVLVGLVFETFLSNWFSPKDTAA